MVSWLPLRRSPQSRLHEQGRPQVTSQGSPRVQIQISAWAGPRYMLTSTKGSHSVVGSNSNTPPKKIDVTAKLQC